MPRSPDEPNQSLARCCLRIEALLLVAAIRLGLWLLPFRAVRSLVASLMPSEPSLPNGGPACIDAVAWAVKRMSRYVPAATCLTQALAAQVLLTRRGIPARLCIGVAKDARQGLVAHAWVESQGRVVVGGSSLDRYARLFVM